MSNDHDPLRRKVIAALASAPLLSLADMQTDSETPRSGSRILVAYFSRSGNTRVVAGLIQRGLGADLFEIRPAKPIPRIICKPWGRHARSATVASNQSWKAEFVHCPTTTRFISASQSG